MTVHSSHKTIEKFDHALKKEDHKEVGKLIQKEFGKSISFEKLEELAKKRTCGRLQNALAAVKKIQTIAVATIEQKDLLETAFYVETRLKHDIGRKKYYLSRDKTKLPFSIEHDPKKGSTFIHTANIIGKGYHKVVTESYEYSTENPQLCARSAQEGHAKNEIAGCNAAKDLEGLLQAKLISSHNKRTLITTKLYRPGPLKRENIVNLTIAQKLKMAQDITRGLNNLHAKGYIHRDLKPDNVYLNKNGDAVEATIGDLGTVQKESSAKGKAPNATYFYNTPEVYEKNLKGINYKKSDIFALGTVLYKIAFEKDAAWVNKKLFPKNASKKKNRSKLQKAAVTVIKAERAAENEKLERQDPKAPETIFKKLILTMVNENPKDRPSAKDALEALKM